MRNSEYSFEEFLTYIMIYAAHLDAEVKVEEVEHIIKKSGEEQYAKMNALFASHNDAETIEFLQEQKSHLVSSGDFGQRISEAMQAVFESDGDFSPFENSTMHLLERILE